MERSIAQAHTDIKEGRLTAVSVAEEALGVIRARDKEVHAFLEVFDDVRVQAERADDMFKRGEATLLTGIPIAVKDNILMKGRQATAGSNILSNFTAPYEATVIRKLREAGAVLVGRTNLDEFAMGSSTEHSAFGVTKNPHDTSRVPGGSSGGSAAAVAMGGVYAALGSDTGGSVRQPAALCGVVGLKPTYGAVSRNGLIAMGSSLDVIGPLARSVADAEAVFRIICGHDDLDSTSLLDSPEKSAREQAMTVGVPFGFLEKGVDPDVLENFRESVRRLEQGGFVVEEVDLDVLRYALPAYYIIMPAEVSTNLARYDGVKYGLHLDGENLLEDYVQTRSGGFGTEARRRILLGTYVLSHGYYDAYYVKAHRARTLLRNTLAHVFQNVDVIAMPTSPTPAFKIGEKSDPLSMYLTDIFTVPANLTGVPALSIPSGFVEREGKRLPVGLQFMGPARGEAVLFEAGKRFENLSL